MTLKLDHLPHPNSLLGRLDPRWKLAALLPATLALAFLHTLPAAAVALVGALLLVALGRLPLHWYLARLSVLSLFLLLVVALLPFLVPGESSWEWGPLRLSWAGLRLALLLCLKAVALVTLMLVWLTTAPLTATLKAAHALRVPGVLVQLVLLTYRYLFVLSAEWHRLRIALRVRGYRNRANRHSYRTVGHVAGTLLVRGAERAERVAQAMRCRGFDGRFRALTEFRTNWSDVVFFVAVIATAGALVIWDLLQT
jgi:cobalt/nickel transport system permease protein